MLNTCEVYAQSHNLKFSTDPNPQKCKTKCMAFLFKNRPLAPMRLCGSDLPWVDQGKHLGNTIENKIDGMSKDLKIKKAQFMQKNSEICQEFYFAHPKTKFKIFQIYNSHLYGSPLWDLFGNQCLSLEKSYNTTIRKMFDLPRETHKYFIEKVTESHHIKSVLINRFLKFTEKLKSSDKTKDMFDLVKSDIRSTTGNNLRKIMLLLDKDSIENIVPSDAKNIVYCETSEQDNWKIGFVKELIDIKCGEAFEDEVSYEELNKILTFICVS